jgi:hypothetical protein
MTNNKFIYDEKTSTLYAPDGRRLRQISCPKAMHWDQLKVEDGHERWRGCTQCRERVVNLDVMDVAEAVSILAKSGAKRCVHGSSDSGRVIFLRDPTAIRPATEVKVDDAGRTVIQTARSAADINRAINLGYWPDVRFVKFDTKNLHSKVSVGQHIETGCIRLSGDYRQRFRKADDPGYLKRTEELEADDFDDGHTASLRQQGENDKWVEVIPFTSYYPYYDASPIAAYLIPQDLADGSSVLIEDPIEDVVGSTWNQGDAYRAGSIPGKLEGRRVVLGKKEPGTVQRFVG